jgi:hypothetical protein
MFLPPIARDSPTHIFLSQIKSLRLVEAGGVGIANFPGMFGPGSPRVSRTGENRDQQRELTSGSPASEGIIMRLFQALLLTVFVAGCVYSDWSC